METLVTALREVGRACQMPAGDRYSLQTPIFRGDSYVEQFIRWLEDVATIVEWPVPVRLLQLWYCLTEPAKSYPLGPDRDHIFQALWARFGTTARNSRDRLQSLRRDLRTSLQDHANAIDKLAQIAYSRTDPEEWRDLIYEAFFKTVGGLQRYYLGAKISTIEKAGRWATSAGSSWLGPNWACPWWVELSSSPGQEEGW